MNKLTKCLFKIIIKLDNNRIIRLSDENKTKIEYYYYFGKKINLKDPKTYNEKIQWLKLYDHKDIYTKMVDKYEVKEYVSNIIGEEYIIPTIGVYDSVDEIDFDKLPNQFVIKCTHDSGGVVLCTDKSKFNIEKAKKRIKHFQKRNFYAHHREWPYKNVKHRIIVEKYMEDDKDKELRDYKLFCFDGKFKMLFIATNRQGEGETCFDFFDRDFNHLPFTNGHPNAKVLPHRPANFEKMIELAEKISKGFPQLRVDFYSVNGKLYFGEITFYHWSGLIPFEPEEWDRKLGDLIKLPNINKK